MDRAPPLFCFALVGKPTITPGLFMKLPHLGMATVPERKITHYLLNPAHPAGGSKAAFFMRFGFVAQRWDILAEALLQHARDHEVIAEEQIL